MILVDSNILIDIFSSDSVWLQWSMHELASWSEQGPFIIDEIIYAEISARATSQRELDAALTELDIELSRIPREALFAAAKAFQRYRARGGNRQNVLPDFFVGAHAQIAHLPLLTRDVKRYRTYFPEVELISPASNN